jgi:anti-sigma regulatory factor (Ser/Thr protein kinase)
MAKSAYRYLVDAVMDLAAVAIADQWVKHQSLHHNTLEKHLVTLRTMCSELA